MRIVVILTLAIVSCAPKKQIQATPGVHRYSHCKEVSIDVKNRTVTVICPLDQ